MTQPIITVIVPVYNKAPYLMKCADSIADQHMEGVEAVFVDDGSTDNSLEVLHQIKEKRGFQIIHTENHGVSHARNTGLDAAKGHYIVFVDGDDRLAPDALPLLMKTIQEQHADLVGGEACMYSIDGKLLVDGSKHTGNIYRAEGKKMLEDCLKDAHYTHHCGATIFRKKLIQDIRFPEGIHAHEDSHFMLLCALKQPTAVVIDEVVAWYTEVPGSLSRSGMTDSKASNILDEAEMALEQVEKHCPEYSEMARNITVKAALSILYSVPSKEMEKKCIELVKKNQKYFIPANSLDRIVYNAVILHLYPLYAAIQCRRLYHCSRKERCS